MLCVRAEPREEKLSYATACATLTGAIDALQSWREERTRSTWHGCFYVPTPFHTFLTSNSNLLLFFFLFSFLREKFLYRLSNPHPSLLFYLHFCFSIDSPPFYSFFIFVLFNFNVNQVNSRSLFFVLFIEILFWIVCDFLVLIRQTNFVHCSIMLLFSQTYPLKIIHAIIYVLFHVFFNCLICNDYDEFFTIYSS